MSQMGWGMWWRPRVGPTTAISVPARGTSLTCPPISLQRASTRGRSSEGMDMVTVSIWELRFFIRTTPPTSSMSSNSSSER